MRQIIFLSLALLIFSGCTNTKKFTHFVNEKYSNISLTSFDYKSDFVTVTADNIIKQDSFCQTERIKASFIPAVFYWYWNNTVKCIIDPKYYAGKLSYYLKKDAETMGMKEKLNGSNIIISIKALPSSFRYENKGHVLFALLAYAMIFKEGIDPVRQNIILEYEIIKNDISMQKGMIEIPDKNVYIKNNRMSRKKITWQFIDDYESNLKNQSKEALVKIINEI